MNTENIEYRLDDLDSEDVKYSGHPSEFVTQNMGVFRQFTDDLFATFGSEKLSLNRPDNVTQSENVFYGTTDFVDSEVGVPCRYVASFVNFHGENRPTCSCCSEKLTMQATVDFWDVSKIEDTDGLMERHPADIVLYTSIKGSDFVYTLSVRDEYLKNREGSNELQSSLLKSKKTHLVRCRVPHKLHHLCELCWQGLFYELPKKLRDKSFTAKSVIWRLSHKFNYGTRLSGQIKL